MLIDITNKVSSLFCLSLDSLQWSLGKLVIVHRRDAKDAEV
jgi:hypothetical protein